MQRFLNVYSRILIAVIVVIAINYIVSFSYFRIDLTAEKRYTLSEVTKNNLDELNDTVYFKVFLSGDLPVSFLRMKNEIRDLFDEFSNYSDGRVVYEFVDPNGVDSRNKEKTQKFLSSHGIIPYTIQEKDDEGKITQRLIFPGSIASNGKKAVSFNFLKNTIGKSTEEAIHSSIQNLEYELLNTIKRLAINNKKKVAMLSGHGELSPIHLYDISMSLSEYYDLDFIDLRNDTIHLNKYSTLIIPKPQKPFSEQDKFEIDQFIMNGGNVVWLVDFVKANMDSLAYVSAIMATVNDINISDQLFKYGVRINYNLVLDNQCATIPINVATEGAPPQFNPAPWYYSPLMRPSSSHITSKNVNLISSEFVSVLDTVGSSKEIKKTVLLQSSKYARVISTPVPVSFDILNQTPDGNFFNRYDLPFAVLLEGNFTSVFENRDVSKYKTEANEKFRNQSEFTRQLVVADGDIIKNDVKTRGRDSVPFPLGYDKFTKQTYGNKDFLMNVINYMNGGEDILQLRSRELYIRLLNKNRINEEKLFWQIINVAVPLLLIILFGLGYTFYRKRKFTRY